LAQLEFREIGFHKIAPQCNVTGFYIALWRNFCKQLFALWRNSNSFHLHTFGLRNAGPLAIVTTKSPYHRGKPLSKKGSIPFAVIYTVRALHYQEIIEMNDRITIDPAICHGKPCIRGMRYPVENLLEWLASGMTTEEILADYPDLERDDILAALSYAARLAHVKRLERLAA
jgi:uncharacterized protein (DUF433 family)